MVFTDESFLAISYVVAVKIKVATLKKRLRCFYRFFQERFVWAEFSAVVPS
jgi:hypothetical protein